MGRGSAVRSIVFSLHFYSFALVLYITSWIIGLLVMMVTHYELPDMVWGITILVLQSLYIMLALAAAYGDGWVARILKGGIAGMATLFILQFYRFVLFVVAFYSAL
jgi:hypothetical protein